MLRRILCVSLVAVSLPLAGCSFIADFDRSKIKHQLADAGIDAAIVPGPDAALPDAGKADAGIDAAVSDAGTDADVDAASDEDAGLADAGFECSLPSDCPGSDGPCSIRTCAFHVCSVQAIVAGNAAVTGQTAGDCHQLRCASGGTTTNAIDNTDPPSDNKECTTDTCNAGSPVHTPLGSGMACPVTAGGKCDGAGTCVACVVAADCPGSDTNCHVRTCSAQGVCGVSNTASGTPTTTMPAQTAGNCIEVQCKGDGDFMDVAVATDTPVDDGIDCTDEICNGTTPQHPVRSANFACDDDDGFFCDGAGHCVECNMASQCTSSICISEACVTPGTLALPTVTPASMLIGAAGTVTLSFSTSNPWPNDGTLSVVFPAAFDVSGAGFSSIVGAAGGGSVIVNGQAITLTRTAGTLTAPGAITVVLSGIENPNASGSSGTFAIATRTAAGVAIDSGTAPAVSIAAGALSALSATPALLVAGATGNVTLAFTTSSSWPLNGKLVVTFPAGYGLSAAGFGSMTGATGSATVGVAGQVVTLTRTGGSATSAGAISVVLSGIDNPGLSGSSGSVAIATQNNAGGAIDSGTAAAVTLSSGALSALSVTPVSLVAGASGNVTLAFTTANTWPTLGKLLVIFPADFDISGAALVSTSTSGTLAVAVVGQQLTLTRSGGSATPANTMCSIVISGIDNPHVSGTTTGGFELSTQNGTGVEIDTGTASAVAITAGVLTAASMSHATRVVQDVGDVTLQLTPANVWPADGKLVVTFPGSYDLMAAAFDSMTGGGDATVVAVGQQLTLTRTTGTALAAGSPISIVLTGIENPAVSGATGSFAISTRTAGNTIIDTGSAPAVTLLISAGVSLSSTITSAVGTASAAASLSKSWPADGSVSIVFPAGFDVSGATFVSSLGIDGGFGAIDIANQTVTLTRSNDGTAVAGGMPISVVIGNVIAPAVAGMTGSYAVTTYDGSAVAIESGTAPGSLITE